MNTSKFAPRLLGSLAVLAVLAVGMTALMPTKALALGGCHCLAGAPFQVIHACGSGTTCAAAEASCIASLPAIGDSTCPNGVCATQNFRWTNSCWTRSNGLKARDCEQEIKCGFCLDP